MDIKELYESLSSKISTNSYTSKTAQVVLQISEKYESHAETILALILYHEMVKIKKTRPDITPVELESKLIKSNGKKVVIYTLPYLGKTFEGGKGIKYLNIDDHTHFPEELKNIIVSYIELIT